MKRVVIAATGDSTTASSGPLSYFYVATGAPATGNIFYNLSQPRVQAGWSKTTRQRCINLANPGWKIQQLTDQLTGASGLYPLSSLINPDYVGGSGRPDLYNILVVRAGTNHDEPSASDWAALLRTYCLAAQAQGWRVIVCSPWSRTGTGEDAFMQAVGDIIDTWDDSDGVVRVVPSTNAVLYGTGAHANATYFSDGIHPTQEGHNIAANEFSLVLEDYIAQIVGLSDDGVCGVSGHPPVITWATSASDVKVYRGTTDRFLSATMIGTGTAGTYTDNATSGGTTYYYWVRIQGTGDTAGFEGPIAYAGTVTTP